MKYLVVLAVVVVACHARQVAKRGVNGDQQPKVWDALKELRGGKDLSVEDQQNLIANAVAGKDYPNNVAIPDKTVECSSFAQPGYYADTDDTSRCQVFHRCDMEGYVTSYLCPNMTLFNQITLICDWFFNVDCGTSKKFENYSNSRLYQEGLFLLDDQMDIAESAEATGAAKVSSTKKSGKSKKSSKGKAKGRSDEADAAADADADAAPAAADDAAAADQ